MLSLQPHDFDRRHDKGDADDQNEDKQRHPHVVDLDLPLALTGIYNRRYYEDKVRLSREPVGIDKNTPDPQGGELVRFEDGSPNGVMLESAMSLIGNCVPKMSDKNQIKECLEFSCKEMLKNGITVAHTEDFTSVSDKRTLWEAYLELAAQGKMPVNLVLQLRIHKAEQMDEFFAFDFHSWEEFGKIKVGPIKFLGDGSLGAWSAGLNEPYSDKPDKEKVRFLKDEYGIGGRSHALSGATHSGEDHDGKGLHYKKQDCPDVHLNWEKVAKRITSLVQKGRYLTEQEQAQYDKIQAEKESGRRRCHSSPAAGDRGRNAKAYPSGAV